MMPGKEGNEETMIMGVDKRKPVYTTTHCAVSGASSLTILSLYLTPSVSCTRTRACTIISISTLFLQSSYHFYIKQYAIRTLHVMSVM